MITSRSAFIIIVSLKALSSQKTADQKRIRHVGIVVIVLLNHATIAEDAIRNIYRLRRTDLSVSLTFSVCPITFCDVSQAYSQHSRCEAIIQSLTISFISLHILLQWLYINSVTFLILSFDINFTPNFGDYFSWYLSTSDFRPIHRFTWDQRIILLGLVVQFGFAFPHTEVFACTSHTV